MSNKLELEDVKQEFLIRGYQPLFNTYNTNNEKLLAKTFEGYMVYTTINSIKSNRVPSIIGNGNPYTIENIKLWLKLNNSPYELLSREYYGNNEKLELKCPKHGKFKMSWNNLQGGHGCCECANNKKTTLEEAQKEFIKMGYVPLFNEYNNANERMCAKTKDGYKISISLSNLKCDKTPSIFGNGNPYTLHNIKLWLNLNESPYELLSTEYKTNNEKLILKCQEHGEFKISWGCLQQGKGCAKCGGCAKITLNEAKNEFVNRGYIPLFDEYINNSKKLIAKTNEGYMIFTSLNNLKSEKDPSVFGKDNPYTIHNIKLWLKINNKPYNLLSEEFIRSDKKLKLFCENHGVFEVSWNKLHDGVGCAKCSGKAKYTLEEAREEFIKQGYIPLFNKYNRNGEKLSAQTLDGYKISTSLGSLKSGKVPLIFDVNNPFTIENIRIKLKLTNSPCELISTEYKGHDKKLIMKCKEHGEFEISWNRIQQGQGCAKCSQSKGEKKIGEWLKNNTIDCIQQKEYKGLVGVGGRSLSYDFYLPKYDLLIEYQGEQHEKRIKWFHKSKKDFEKQQEHDKRKCNYAKINNIKLLEIWYYDFDRVEEILEKELLYRGVVE